jgi:hypothetical protein
MLLPDGGSTASLCNGLHMDFIRLQMVGIDVSLEALQATEFNEIFSDSGAVCAGGLVLLNNQHTLKMGTE